MATPGPVDSKQFVMSVAATLSPEPPPPQVPTDLDALKRRVAALERQIAARSRWGPTVIALLVILGLLFAPVIIG